MFAPDGYAPMPWERRLLDAQCLPVWVYRWNPRSGDPSLARDVDDSDAAIPCANHMEIVVKVAAGSMADESAALKARVLLRRSRQCSCDSGDFVANYFARLSTGEL